MPFDAGAGANITEDDWRLMAANFCGTGVLTGIDNELLVYGDASGMNVKVATGACYINGHYGRNTSIKTLTISAADATNARNDLVVARVDYTTNVIEFDVITGTPAGSPTTPTVTVNSSMYEIALAVVNVPALDTSIASNQVTDTRAWSTKGSGDLSATVAFSAYSSGNTTLNSTPAKLAVNTELFDPGSDYDAATNYRFTAPSKGIYHFDGRVQFTTPGDGNNIAVYIYKNGSAFTEGIVQGFNVGGANSCSLTVSCTVQLNVGDYVELFGSRATGSGNGQGGLAGYLVGRIA